MTVASARRKLQTHGKTGNFRFKGLLLAALDRDNSTEDYAKAWPTANKSDYRFLANNEERSIEMERNRTTVGEQGTDRYRTLKDYAINADNLPKRLSGSKHLSDEDGKIEARLDDAIPRMLFAASDQEEIDTLFREQLLETVMAGAERRKIARDAANVINAETRQGDVPVASDEVFAPALAQGSGIRDDRELYDTIEWNTTKHGQGARVTDELVDQAMVDVIERQIEFIGAAVENSINRTWLTTLVDNAANNFDTAGADQGYSALNSAFGEVDKQDFIPDSYVTHPEYRTILFDDTNLAYANRAGTADVLQNREEASLVDNLAGLDSHAGASSNTYDSDDGSETWGFANDGEKGAVVYDSNHIHVVMYNPDGNDIQIKDYEDPIRDLNGVNARVYHDTVYSQRRSAATVEY
jgi:hypothetical protein